MDKVRIGVIGVGCRGFDHVRLLSKLPDVEMTAVCDLYEDRCEKTSDYLVEEGFEKPFLTTDYKEVLTRENVDAVLITANWEAHSEIAVAAMKAKKTVALEVGGAMSVDECWDLVNTYEETKTPIMFLENCCYGKYELLVQNLVRDGRFGEIVHCHGAYAHDLREEVAGGKENRHYRLQHYLNRNCENYPTHELGPIAKILDINRGNKMNRLVAVASKAAGMKQYVNDRKDTIVNKDLIGAEFKQGDIVNTIITCENGETISLKLDTTLPRSYSREFTVRGTKGMYEENTNTVFIEGDDEQFSSIKHYKQNIDNGLKYEEKYLPDKWKYITKEQFKLGHGGIDYFMHLAFLDAVKNNKPMPIDVYDAASWMCITALSEYSIANGNIPVEIPDFTRGEWKNRKRFDIEL